jgi:integrase
MKHLLIKELVDLTNRNRDGSFSTQATRKDVLVLVGRQLLDGGFRNLGATGLKPKHIQYLLNLWQSDGLSTATIKNRMAHLRWVAEKINKQNIIPRKNSGLGIDRRRYVAKHSKAIQISDVELSKITDERMRLSIELQRAFGLRREECLKFQPSFAMSGSPDSIKLKASWCKGGRERVVPVRTDYQREVLERASALVGPGSMIPAGQSYIKRLKQYEYITNRIGLNKLHGLRHEYAQNRFFELAGFECPARGGPTSRKLTSYQKSKDREARLKISNELGHNREAITAVYLGR